MTRSNASTNDVAACAAGWSVGLPTVAPRTGAVAYPERVAVPVGAAVPETADESGRAPSRTSVDVDSLDYGELAAALYAADIPARSGTRPPLDELRALVEQGVDRLGLARVRYVAEETRRLNFDMLVQSGRGEDTSWWSTAIRRLWPSRRREEAAIALAYSMIMRRPARTAGQRTHGPAIRRT